MPTTNLFEKILVPVMSVIVIAVLFLLYFESMQSVKTDTIYTPVAIKNYADPFKEIFLSAKSAIVWDVKGGRIVYEKESDMVLPLASLTKVMMAITAADLVPKSTVIVIRKEFLEEEGDSGLFVDESWTLKDLLDFSLMTSSNDGSRAVASVIGAVKSGTANYTIGRQEFVREMNEKAEKIGLSQTYFSNENGLDTDEPLGGAYGTVRDVAYLFEYALRNYPEVMESTTRSERNMVSLNNIVHRIYNTNWNVYTIPAVIASKTGYTSLAGGNLAIAFDPELGRPIIISVLGSTRDGRFTDIATLIEATREYLDNER